MTGEPDAAARLEEVLERLSSEQQVDAQIVILDGASKRLGGPVGASLGRLRDAIAGRDHFTQRIFRTTPTAIYVYDLIDQRTVFSSRSIVDLLQYSQDELLSMAHEALPRLMHPEDLVRIGPYFGAFQGASDDEVRTFEYRMRRRDGAWRWFHSRDTVFRRDSDGKVREIIGSAIDITDRRQAEE
ncbi:MAG: PAS domain S-box protein, partial [Planctomycetota bacterium]